jgi:hypothetical protein
MRKNESWFDKVMRWGQVNLKEDDPLTLDVEFWKRYWQRTKIQGVTINAGVGVAYYPTKIPLHRKAKFLGERDVFGELVAAARQLGLRVLARLDPNWGHEELYKAHPDWFLSDENGKPRQRGQATPTAREPQFLSATPFAQHDVLYSTCWNSPFHREFVPAVMTEIMERYDVDGFFTNGWPPTNWHPVDMSLVCYCPHCLEKWRKRGHERYPQKPDPSDPLWRDFVLFVQESIEEVQTLWTEHTKRLKPSAVFVWNSHGSLSTGLRWDKFVQRADLLNDDSQGRRVGEPLWVSGRCGKVMMAVAEGKPVLRISGVWQLGQPLVRHIAKPAAETTLFSAEAVANGQRLWWHVLGAELYDRRWLEPVADYFSWLAEIEPYLRNIESLADVAIVWSPQTFWLDSWTNMQPSPTEAFNGWYQALLEGRVPFDLLPEWKLATETVRRYKVLILPSQTCLRQESLDALKEFVANGGGLVACFEAGTKNLWGEKHDSGKWSELMGVLRVDEPPPPLRHCYLRILEQQRSHPLLNGFDNTDILPGATYLSRVEKVGDTEALCDFVPTYPLHPPEKVYPDPKQTGLPLLFCRERNGRSVYLAMDFDAAFWRSRLPDHKRLLLNAVNWVRKGEPLPVTVSGNGLLDVTIWRQERSITVHLVNLNTPNLFGGPVTEIVPVGRQELKVVLPEGAKPVRVKLLRAKLDVPVNLQDDELTVVVPQVLDHEVVAIEIG